MESTAYHVLLLVTQALDHLRLVVDGSLLNLGRTKNTLFLVFIARRCAFNRKGHDILWLEKGV